MKHFFATLAVSALSLAAYAQPSFATYTTDPEEGIVESIPSIEVTFTGCNEVDINSGDAIYLLDSNYDEVPGRLRQTGNGILFTPAETITAPGEYIFVIGEGALCGYDESYNAVDNEAEIYIRYLIEGQGGGSESGALNYDDYTSTPAEGEVEALDAISVTFPNIYDTDINSSDDIVFTHNGNAISGLKVKGGDALKVTLPEAQTAPGSYQLTIKAGALCGFNSSYDEYLDNPEDIVLNWSIKNAAAAVDFAYTTTPANGAVVGSLEAMTFAFGSLSEVAVATGADITINGQTLEPVNYTLVAGSSANELKVAFSPAITAETAETVVKIAFVPGSLSGTQDGKTGANLDEIAASVTVVPAVSYSLELALSTPTKPNADGEISAEKQLGSFFFVADMAGLVAASDGTANVTIREIDGDYESTAALRKAYGLDQNKSYFSAAFTGEPTYNGRYEIIIEQGAFGNEIWAANHELGLSNPRQVMTFTLVDGRDRNVYTLEPSAVTPAEGTYASGSEFSTVTVEFTAAGVKATEASQATLAGVNSSFASNVMLTDNGDGTFTARFSTPSENGTYRLSIPAGAFAAPDGQKSAAIERTYRLDRSTAIDTIEAASAPREAYTLQGVRVTGPLTPGSIYIINGRKTLVK